MVSGSQRNSSSRNGTPLAELEDLHLVSNRNSPSPSANMTQHSNTPSPSSTPPPSGLKFSFAKGVAPQLKNPSKLSNGITAFHGHDDSDSEDESHKTSKVTHLENGAVIGEQRREKQENKPLVIKPPESHNEHWLQRRLKMFRPDMVDSQPPENVDLSNIPDRIGDGTVKVGLQLTTRRQKSPESVEEQEQETEMQVDEPPKTEDELARELLIRQAMDPNSVVSTVPKIVIPARTSPLTESDVYAYDMSQLSDAPTLETYERVPVEAFGMGILLGLGWKEGTDLKGEKVEKFKEPKKRPDFLGIGAKEEEFLRKDDKGRKLSRKDGLGGSWNPLKKIDKDTGEVVVEDRKDGGRRSTPKERVRSGVSTPRGEEGSRYGTPSGGRDLESGKERDRRDDDRDRRRDDRRRDDDRDRRKEKYRDDDHDRRDRRHDSNRDLKRRDREYDSERESRRKDGEYDSDREPKRKDREYESDRELKRKDRGYDSDRKATRGHDYDSDYDYKRRREEKRDDEVRSTNGGSHRGSRRPSPERTRSRSPSKKK